ncbi:hypothetical protein B9G98_03367 [Wickerhamiella sorbophila]|uniref:Uncharacterized protein n=1 Tax=Wickerhamiella sorbophila TaxID=45607 RepID=A0A2T0FLA3_9ASCO|nr:hypothetical protein B9G98_03367 [Wickerhamiella sorbophila]PRT55747.1 hypothetical protein B9G98_03367 [Wickerhamiella sorbophila]
MQFSTLLTIATFAATSFADAAGSAQVSCWTKIGGTCYGVADSVAKRELTSVSTTSPYLVNEDAIIKVSPATLSSMVQDLHLDGSKVANFFGLAKSDATTLSDNSNSYFALTSDSLDALATYLDVPLEKIANYFGLYASDASLEARYDGRSRECYQYLRSRCWRIGGANL